MMDARCAQLEELLVSSGWFHDGEALVAPHMTMAIAPSTSMPNFESFREAMSGAVAASEQDGEDELHDDLVSLVSALDVVLAGN